MLNAVSVGSIFSCMLCHFAWYQWRKLNAASNILMTGSLTVILQNQSHPVNWPLLTLITQPPTPITVILHCLSPVWSQAYVHPPAPLQCPLSSPAHLAQEERLLLNTVQSGLGAAGTMPCVHFHILSSPVLCFLSRSHTSGTAGPAPRPALLLSASQHDYKDRG